MAKNRKQFSIEVDNYKTHKVLVDSDDFNYIAGTYMSLCRGNKNSECIFYLYDNEFVDAIFECYKGEINTIN